jgi:APA family basic amino acid/polyamine antiporter
MLWKRLFATKSLETLLAEMAGDNRLRRVLGPVALTSLGVGAIIGAGIFALTGQAAAEDAGPAIMLSFVVAGFGCALAAFCYAEFAAMAPVAGSAYTYAYATLGELMAWIIGWDLILEYAMGGAVVASSWSGYLNSFLKTFFDWEFPFALCNDPFTVDKVTGERGLFNLPAMLIMLLVTTVLTVGIRESATTNNIMVMIKVVVVVFVIVVGWGFIHRANWTGIPETERVTPEELAIPRVVEDYVTETEKQTGSKAKERIKQLTEQVTAAWKLGRRTEATELLLKQGKLTNAEALAALRKAQEEFNPRLPQTPEDNVTVDNLLHEVHKEAPQKAAEKWGLLATLGLNRWLVPIDDGFRSPFAPYGLSGLMLAAAVVFFAYIGFDSISTHAEEARRPQRDVPIGILASLAICTVLYILVAAVITGIERYPDIDLKAAVSEAFRKRAEAEGSWVLRASAGLIATGALAGMTSVLLVTFLSQARIFLAMARDHLLPYRIFGVVHPRFRTPHISTMVTGGAIAAVAAVTPIQALGHMVSIGTLMAFVIVCAAVLILRVQRPDAHRPFRCPVVWVVAPLGMLVNLIMMLFLPPETWLRLLIWLAVGLTIYFVYGYRHSLLGRTDPARSPAAPG